MAKKVNKNLVVGLTFAVFGLMIILSVLMITQLRKQDPEHFVAQAEEAKARGNWESANAYYMRAWNVSKDQSHLIGAGEMLLEAGRVGEALGTWNEAITSKPSLVEGYERILDVHLTQTEFINNIELWRRIQTTAEGLLEQAPDKALGHHALGLAYFNLRLEEPTYAEQGLEELKEAIRRAPDEVDYQIDLANCYGQLENQARRRSQAQEANRWAELQRSTVEQMYRHFNEPGLAAVRARRAMAAYQVLKGDEGDVEKYYREALTLGEGDPEAYLEARLAYAVYLSTQWAREMRTHELSEEAKAQYKTARELLEACIEEAPDEYPAYQRLALMYQANEEYEKAIQVCDARLERGIERVGLTAIQDRAMTVMLHTIESECYISLWRQTTDVDKKSEYLQAALDAADSALGEVRNPRALTQKGQVLWAMGQDRDALELLREADEMYRGQEVVDWRHKNALARVHLRLNEPGSALKVLEEVLPAAEMRTQMQPDAPRDAALWALYAEVYLQNRRMEDAQAMAERALRLNPDDTMAEEVRYRVMRDTGQGTDSTILGDNERLRLDALVREANEKANDGDLEGAATIFRSLLADDPNNLALLRAFVQAMNGAGQPEMAHPEVITALKSDPENASLKRLEAVTRPNSTEAEREQALLAVIESTEDAFTRSFDLSGFYFTMANRTSGEERNEHLGKALEHVLASEQHWVNKDTDAAKTANIQLFRDILNRKMLIGAMLDDQNLLLAAAETARDWNVDGARGKTFEGQLHMFNENAEEAIKAFNEALELQPTNFQAWVNLGKCYESLNQLTQAEACFKRAIEINPTNGRAYKSITQLAKRQGNEEDFQRYFETLKDLIPNDAWVQREMTREKERDNPEVAIQRREKGFTDNPDDLENVAQLARLHEEVGNTERASFFYEKLLEVVPDDQRVVGSVSQFWARVGNIDRAREICEAFIDKAESPEAKANAHVPLVGVYVQRSRRRGIPAEEIRNQFQMAETTLLRAADLAETFTITRSLADFYMQIGEPGKALMWYDNAVTRARLEATGQVRDTQLARIECLLHPRLGDTETAEIRIDELLNVDPDDTAALFWKAEVLARRGQMEDAIEFMTRFLEQQPMHARGLQRRAELYESMGLWEDAIGDLERLRSSQPNALRYRPRVQLAALYQRTGQDNKWIRELEAAMEEIEETRRRREATQPNSANQDPPGFARVSGALIDAYMELGRYSDAERVVTAQINNRPNDPERYFRRATISAEQQNFDTALADARQATEVAGYTARSLTRTLVFYIKAMRFAEGAAYASEHSPSDGPTSILVMRTAELLALAGQSELAIRQYRRAMALAIAESDNDAEAIRLVHNSIYINLRDKALDLLDSVPVQDPNLRLAHQHLRLPLLRVADRHEEADALFKSLMEEAGSYAARANLWVIEGIYHQTKAGEVTTKEERKECYAKAKAAYEEAIKYDASRWLALNNLAYLLGDQMGQYSLALPYAERVALIRPHPDVLDTLGWIYVGMGKYDRAVGILTRAVQGSPDAPLHYYHLAEAYRRTAEFAKAEDLYERGKSVAIRMHAPKSLLEDIETGLNKARNRNDAP
jgi:tetratricopeptide (TPR) repeat protein